MVSSSHFTMNMYRELILYGFHMHVFEYRIEYDDELAIAGLPAYYVHRQRYKGDGLRSQRTISELPIPEPAVLNLKIIGNEVFADVVIAETFEEALTFLSNVSSAMTFKGSVFEELSGKFAAERLKIEQDAKIAHEDEKAELQNEKIGQLTIKF